MKGLGALGCTGLLLALHARSIIGSPYALPPTPPPPQPPPRLHPQHDAMTPLTYSSTEAEAEREANEGGGRGAGGGGGGGGLLGLAQRNPIATIGGVAAAILAGTIIGGVAAARPARGQGRRQRQPGGSARRRARGAEGGRQGVGRRSGEQAGHPSLPLGAAQAAQLRRALRLMHGLNEHTEFHRCWEGVDLIVEAADANLIIDTCARFVGLRLPQPASAWRFPESTAISLPLSDLGYVRRQRRGDGGQQGGSRRDGDGRRRRRRQRPPKPGNDRTYSAAPVTDSRSVWDIARAELSRRMQRQVGGGGERSVNRGGTGMGRRWRWYGGKRL